MTAREKKLFEEQARQLAEIQAVLEEQKIEEETKLEEKIISSIVLSLQIIFAGLVWYFTFWYGGIKKAGFTMNELYGTASLLPESEYSVYMWGFPIFILFSIGGVRFIQQVISLCR